MIWNALQANTVIYLTSTTGAIEFQPTTTTLLDKVYGAATVTGIMTSIDYNLDTKENTTGYGQQSGTKVFFENTDKHRCSRITSQNKAFRMTRVALAVYPSADTPIWSRFLFRNMV